VTAAAAATRPHGISSARHACSARCCMHVQLRETWPTTCALCVLSFCCCAGSLVCCQLCLRAVGWCDICDALGSINADVLLLLLRRAPGVLWTPLLVIALLARLTGRKEMRCEQLLLVADSIQHRTGCCAAHWSCVQTRKHAPHTLDVCAQLKWQLLPSQDAQ
jgi:hypothetical protein